MALMTKTHQRQRLRIASRPSASEVDALIDKRVQQLKHGYGDYPPAEGVPESVLRNILTNRSDGCLCKAALNISEAGEPLR